MQLRVSYRKYKLAFYICEKLFQNFIFKSKILMSNFSSYVTKFPTRLMLCFFLTFVLFIRRRIMNNLILAEKVGTKKESSPSLLPLSSKVVENEISTNHEMSVDLVSSCRKVVNIANLIDEKLRKGDKFFSLELNSEKKFNNAIFERFVSELSLHSISPLFYATTSHQKFLNDEASVQRSFEILKKFPSNTLLHLVANDLKQSEIRKILDNALAQGKINIFALRGDNCTGNGDFLHAIDLVKFIRENYGNKFVICVAGFPQMHPESVSKKMDIDRLKEKVDAGANFIITQIFYESRVFIDFVNDCRKSGIVVPIIPGIFPIPNFEIFLKMAKLCSFEIPPAIMTDLEAIKNNDDEVYAYGIEIIGKLINEIFASGTANGFHLFTLNRVSVAVDVCKQIFH